MSDQPEGAGVASDHAVAYVPIVDFTEFLSLATDQTVLASQMQALNARRTAAGVLAYRQCLDVIVRAAAVETGAVELLYETSPGMTMSVALDEPGWRDEIDSQGQNASQHVEAQLAVYSAIRSTPGQFTEVWVRELHKDVTEGQDTYSVQTPVGVQARALPRGSYKDAPNEVRTRAGGRHLYAPVQDTGPEMSRFIDALNSEEFKASDPVVQATYAHWAIAHIHPFADGNGRVARALASLFLLQGLGVPFLIFADRKYPYFQALEAMDLGDLQRGLAYFENRCFDAMDWLIELLDASVAPTGNQLAAELTELFGQSSEPIESRDDAAVRVTTAVLEAIERAAAGTGGFSGSVLVEYITEYYIPDRPFRPIQVNNLSELVRESYPESEAKLIGHYGNVGLILETSTPVALRNESKCSVLVASDAAGRHAVALRSTTGIPRVYLRLEDISPDLSASAKIRIETYAGQLFRWTLGELVDDARRLLIEHGRARFAGKAEPGGSGGDES